MVCQAHTPVEGDFVLRREWGLWFQFLSILDDSAQAKRERSHILDFIGVFIPSSLVDDIWYERLQGVYLQNDLRQDAIWVSQYIIIHWLFEVKAFLT